MKIQKLPSINGLRAFSIILVICHHLSLQNSFFKDIPTDNWGYLFVEFIKDGHLGVNVFFVISGFLITYLLQYEEKNTETISLKNFYVRRTLRIFPAYFFLLFVYFILQLFNFIQISNSSWLTAITYTKYFNWELDWYTGHAWSLSIEEHFYVFWPLIFIGGKKFRKIVAISLIIIVPFIRYFSFYHPVYWINELTIFTRIDSIAVGCFFALYKENIIKHFTPHWTKIFYFSIISLFFLRIFPIYAHKTNLDFIFIPIGSTHGTIANILIASIMMYSVFGPKRIWYKVLNLKIINYIGTLSYSIYLWQQLFIYQSDFWINKFPQNLIFIFLAALFSYYIIEKPFLKLKQKFSEEKE